MQSNFVESKLQKFRRWTSTSGLNVGIIIIEKVKETFFAIYNFLHISRFAFGFATFGLWHLLLDGSFGQIFATFPDDDCAASEGNFFLARLKRLVGFWTIF